jgi:hypothetical protein
MISSELLSKFSFKPGLCSIEELNEVKDYYISYKAHQDLYKKSIGTEATKHTLDSKLSTIEWYQNHLNGN